MADQLPMAKADEGALPSVDSLLGPAQPQQGGAGLPSVDDVLGPPVKMTMPVLSGPAWDHYFSSSYHGDTLDAFGQGFKQGWGSGNLGLSPETEEALKKWGVFPDVQKGQGGILRSINEAVIRPAAVVADTLWRGLSGVATGALEFAKEGLTEEGFPRLGREAAGVGEYLMTSEMARGGNPAAHALNEAKAFHVIGEGEEGWKGTPTQPTAMNESAVADMVKQQQKEAANTYTPGSVPHTYAPEALGPQPTEAPIQPYETATPPPLDVHEAARRIAPDTFSEYDALSQRRDALRDQIAQEQDALRQQAEAQAPHADEIADLEQRLQDTTPRLAKKYQARLAELLPERDAFLNDEFTMSALTRDTDEIASLRQELQQTDFRMRDLAPDVTAAYRQAAEQFPAPEETAGEPAIGMAPERAAPEVPAAEEPKVVPAAASQEAPQGQLPLENAPGEQPRVVPAAAEVNEAPKVGQLAADEAEKPLASLPPVRDGYVRLYHGGPPEGSHLPTTGGGRWVAENFNYARDYRRGASKKPGAVWYVDLPKGSPEVEAATDHEAVAGTNMKAPIRSFEASAETAKGFKPANQAAVDTERAAAGEKSAVQPARTIPASIAQDVANKLTAAGRPAEEANAAAAIIEAHYEARAARFEGKRGTAQEMYAHDAPEIKGAERGGRRGAASGKAVVKDGRTTITLFGKADASTFIHETGHHWLEELMSDAKDAEAPAAVKADADKVRNWLGAKEGETITARQHEKFARGFERYMMEGVAPSRALEGVFAQFREWLNKIYQTVQRLRAPITDDIRDVFDRMLAEEPEPATVAREPEMAEAVASSRETYSRANTPYTKTGKEPARLVSFIRKIGGMRDEGGDVANTLGGSKYRPGLINKAGLPDDEVALRAWEAGYFPEFGDERPSINDLRNAIEEDLKGEPRYSHYDEDRVAEFNKIKDQNAEIDRLASEHGIDTKGLTREQFFDKVAEKLSHTEAEAEIRSQEEAHEREFDVAASEARELHGEDWDADKFYGINGPRTLEDLESAYRQESTARPVGQGSPHGGESDVARGSEGHSAEGGEPRGGGAGASGRGGEEGGAAKGGAAPRARTGSTERPAGPQSVFPEQSEQLVDKAGNIRLDLLTDEDDIRQALKAMADRNGDFMEARRGVVSDAAVLDMAQDINADPAAIQKNIARLRQMSLEDGMPLAARIRAGREMLVQAASNVHDLAAKAVTGSDADVIAYAQAMTRLNMIQETVAGVTAEVGRGLRAFRDMKAEMAEVGHLTALAKDATGRTLFQLREQAQMALKLDTPAEVAKFARDQMRPDFWDYAVEYFINNLISNPITHTTYAIGNELLTMWRALPETALKAAAGGIHEAIAGHPVERAYWGEVGAGLYGFVRGSRQGMIAAGKAVLTGDPVKLPGEKAVSFALQQRQQGAIPGKLGTVIRMPGRMVAAIHALARFQNYEMGISQQAYRMAIKEGLEGDAFAQRVAQLEQNPTPEMMASARQEATQTALMGRGGEFSQAVVKLANSRLLGTKLPKLIIPFAQISSNIMSEGLVERTPIGLINSTVRDNLMGRNGTLAQHTQIAQITAGSALAGLAVWMAAEGSITGGEPENPRDAAAWRATGKQPYSIKIGGTWYSYARLGVMAKPLGLAADLWDIGAEIGEKDLTQVTAQIAASFAHLVLDESSMRGLSDALNAVNDPQRYGGKWIKNMAVGFLPFTQAMGQAAREIDPYARNARGIIDAIKARIPFVSETVAPRIDVWGQPVAAGTTLGGLGLTAIYTSQESQDPTVRRLAQLQAKGWGVWPSMPERKIVGQELTDAQYEEYARLSGRTMKMRLDGLIHSPGFAATPEGVQVKAIKEIEEGSRKLAGEIMKMRHPEIVTNAIAFKKALLSDTPPPKH